MPTLETEDKESLLRACEGDPEALLILADWYEERGQSIRGEACRWMVREGKGPVSFLYDDNSRSDSRGGVWALVNGGRGPEYLPHWVDKRRLSFIVSRFLPGGLYYCLPDSLWSASTALGWHSYKTHAEALVTLIETAYPAWREKGATP